jgi:hypothetical protein
MHRITYLRLIITIQLLAPMAGFSQVVLNEVMYDPAGPEHHDEFVELKNLSIDAAVDLRGWSVGDGEELDSLVDVGDGLTLGPGQLGLVLDASYFGNSTTYEHVPTEAILLTIDDRAFGKMGWSNSSEETVLLKGSAGETIDLFTYSSQRRSGFSWERADSTGAGRPRWDLTFHAGGTPAARNSREFIFVPQQLKLEVDPNPFVRELFIRLSLPARSGLVNLWLFDIEGSRVNEILIGEEVSTDHEFRWNGKDKNGREVPPGPYIVYVEANIGGIVQQQKIVVVRAVE